jgi:hypothetical protein
VTKVIAESGAARAESVVNVPKEILRSLEYVKIEVRIAQIIQALSRNSKTRDLFLQEAIKNRPTNIHNLF